MSYRQIYEFLVACDAPDCDVAETFTTTEICAHKYVPHDWRKDDDGTLWCERHA